MQLPLLFQVAEGSRDLVSSIEATVQLGAEEADGEAARRRRLRAAGGTDSDEQEENGFQDVSDVGGMYSWILALHEEVAKTDWVNVENFKTFTEVSRTSESNKVEWDPDRHIYIMPDWMQKFTVKARSWVVSGWQITQERAAIRMCDSKATGNSLVGDVKSAYIGQCVHRWVSILVSP
jgi:hypothetical protein